MLLIQVGLTAEFEGAFQNLKTNNNPVKVLSSSMQKIVVSHKTILKN